MTASDHLGQQFTELYHATRASVLPSIRATGLTAGSYSATNPTVTTDRAEAEMYARGHMINRGEQPGIATLRVPSGQEGDYLHADATAHRHSGAYGLRKPLPASMVHSVDAL